MVMMEDKLYDSVMKFFRWESKVTEIFYTLDYAKIYYLFYLRYLSFCSHIFVNYFYSFFLITINYDMHFTCYVTPEILVSFIVK